jgi:creatinine amidohydrolase
MYWQDLTSPEFRTIDRATPVVLPVAAVEQHGPHLPVATDRMIAEHFANQLNERLGSSVLILPTVAVGCSEHHMSFPGSLTLRHETFLNVCQQYLHSASAHGFRNFLVLNAHGGNRGVCQVLLEKFGAEHPNCQIAVASWWRIAAEELLPLNEAGVGGVGHACEFETSLLLSFAPHTVRMEAIEPKRISATYDWAEEDLLRTSRISLYRSMKQIARNGVWGDPTCASAAKGRQITEVVCEVLTTAVTEMATSKSCHKSNGFAWSGVESAECLYF